MVRDIWESESRLGGKRETLPDFLEDVEPTRMIPGFSLKEPPAADSERNDSSVERRGTCRSAAATWGLCVRLRLEKVGLFRCAASVCWGL